MSHATSAMPARVALDWRHGQIGPLAPCVLRSRPAICRSLVKNVLCARLIRLYTPGKGGGG